MAAALPDDLWTRILDLGVRNSGLNYKDLCRLSISCRRLNRLSSDDSLWSFLLSSDFSSSSTPLRHASDKSNSKTLYKIRFEKERDRRLLAHRRAVLRKESEVGEKVRRLREIEGRLGEEREKFRSTRDELLNLHKIRQASTALNVWQPEVIRGRQKQIVEQCVVPMESRIHALEMELKLCKQQIAGCENAYRDEKRKLEVVKEELMSLKYHPLQECPSARSGVEERSIKRRKLKKSINREASKASVDLF